jgi:hypothetical protein
MLVLRYCTVVPLFIVLGVHRFVCLRSLLALNEVEGLASVGGLLVAVLGGREGVAGWKMQTGRRRVGAWSWLWCACEGWGCCWFLDSVGGIGGL